MKVKFIIVVAVLLTMACAGYSVHGTETENFMRSGVMALAEPERNNSGIIIRVDLKKIHKIDLHGEYMKQICLTDNGSPVWVDEVKKVVSAKDQYVVQK